VGVTDVQQQTDKTLLHARRTRAAIDCLQEWETEKWLGKRTETAHTNWKTMDGGESEVSGSEYIYGFAFRIVKCRLLSLIRYYNKHCAAKRAHCWNTNEMHVSINPVYVRLIVHLHNWWCEFRCLLITNAYASWLTSPILFLRKMPKEFSHFVKSICF
jgi:hypothetical protein